MISLDTSSGTINITKIPKQYCLTAKETQRLYRGDLVGIEQSGIPAKIFSRVSTQEISQACADYLSSILPQHFRTIFSRVIQGFRDFDNMGVVHEMKTLLESGSEEIIDLLIKWHTDNMPFSPFVSTSFSPKLAQSLASKWGSSTVYEICVLPNRVICDAKNEGRTGLAGEIFIFGGVNSNEITRVKSENTPERSELYEAPWLKRPCDFDLSDFSIKDESNWRRAAYNRH